MDAERTASANANASAGGLGSTKTRGCVTTRTIWDSTTSDTPTFSAPVNRSNSPFGAGWDLAGLQEIVPLEDGSLLLIDGDGSDTVFDAPIVMGGPFVSPAGDFSVLERLMDGTFRQTFPEQTVMQFNQQNKIASVTDRNGNQLTYQYDGQGRVTSEQNGTGDTTTYAYTTAPPYELTTVTIPGRGSWVDKHRGYMLMSVIDPLNRTTSYTHDSMGRTASETDGRGNTRRYEYDASGNVVKEMAPVPLDYTTARAFNASNDLLTETDGRGNTTTYAYAASGDAGAD